MYCARAQFQNEDARIWKGKRRERLWRETTWLAYEGLGKVVGRSVGRSRHHGNNMGRSWRERCSFAARAQYHTHERKKKHVLYLFSPLSFSLSLSLWVNCHKLFCYLIYFNFFFGEEIIFILFFNKNKIKISVFYLFFFSTFFFYFFFWIGNVIEIVAVCRVVFSFFLCVNLFVCFIFIRFFKK